MLGRVMLTWIWPIVLLAAIVVSVRQCVDFVREDPYEPLSIIAFRVEPSSMSVGEVSWIHNGLCVDEEEAILVAIFLGAETIDADPIVEGEVIPLIGDGDTPEGRLRRTIGPGCVVTEPLETTLSTDLEPGRYRLYLHIQTTDAGRMQDIVLRSNEFEILP